MPATESPTSSTLTGLVEAVAGRAGVRYDSVVVVDVGAPRPRVARGARAGGTRWHVVEDGALTLSWDPGSSAAPTGTRVLAKTAPMAAAAAMGAATQERQCFSAPRRMGISTRS